MVLIAMFPMVQIISNNLAGTGGFDPITVREREGTLSSRHIHVERQWAIIWLIPAV